jgi:hypothetical protein
MESISVASHTFLLKCLTSYKEKQKNLPIQTTLRQKIISKKLNIVNNIAEISTYLLLTFS